MEMDFEPSEEGLSRLLEALETLSRSSASACAVQCLMRLRHSRHKDRAPSYFLPREQRKSLFINDGRGKPGRIAVAADVRLHVVLPTIGRSSD
jgi:hypothetical protein